MDAQLNADIEIADALYRQTIILGKTRDPHKKISAGKAEIKAKGELDELRAQAGKQSKLALAGARS